MIYAHMLKFHTLRNLALNISSGKIFQYSTSVVKYDRHGYKPRERILLVTNKAIYLLDGNGGKVYKQKHKLPLDVISLVVTAENDGLLMIRIPAELKKDKVK